MSQTDENSSTIAVPQKSDRLFRGDLRDWMNNACLNVTGNGDAYAYKAGYRRGAEILIDYVCQHGRDQDFLVYPIIFLYRHHVELMLKRIVKRIPYVIDARLTDTQKNHLEKHRLDLLWQDLRNMLPSVCKAAGWEEIDAAHIEGIDEYIRQLSELDAESFSFRYSHSKKGKQSLPRNLKNVNLRHFGELMRKLANYLYGMDEAVSWLFDTKAETELQSASDLG